MEICPACGDIAAFGVNEVFLDLRELVVTACCPENLDGWLDVISSWSRRERAKWMLQQTGIHVRDVIGSGDVLSWTLDYGLHLEQISFADAKEFIRQHHRHCEPPVGWQFGSQFSTVERS